LGNGYSASARTSNVYSCRYIRWSRKIARGNGLREEEITVLLNAPRADRVKNITYVKYEVCQLVESASSLLALDIAWESKVSALGLKFLGPAQRFTRSRGYGLSSQEVMPSSRREYQIYRRCAPPLISLSLSLSLSRFLSHSFSLFTLSRSRIPYVFKPVSRVAPQVRANLSPLKNPRKFSRADFSRGTRENCGLSRRSCDRAQGKY